jgi:hypothetical protein
MDRFITPSQTEHIKIEIDGQKSLEFDNFLNSKLNNEIYIGLKI